MIRFVAADSPISHQGDAWTQDLGAEIGNRKLKGRLRPQGLDCLAPAEDAAGTSEFSELGRKQRRKRLLASPCRGLQQFEFELSQLLFDLHDRSPWL
jgi:hypothetical protein